MSLTTDLKDDIDRSFERLIKNSSLENKEETISSAVNYLNEHLARDYPDSIKEGLVRGRELIEKINTISNKRSQKIILASLEYLIDPWDIIPDFIAEKGFLDDIYVLDQAFIRLKAAAESEEKEDQLRTLQLNPEDVLNELGNAGTHLSARAYDLNLFNPYQRRALQDISKNFLNNKDLTRKQKVFYTVLVEKLIEAGIIEKSCPDHPCSYCYQLKKLNRKIAS